MCRYLVVRSDGQFTQVVATSVVTALLTTIPSLEQDSPGIYHGLDATVRVLLLLCDRDGNYALSFDQPPPDEINKVELICYCQGPQRDPEWEVLASRIAELLSWEVVDDETGEILYPSPGDGGIRRRTHRPGGPVDGGALGP